MGQGKETDILMLLKETSPSKSCLDNLTKKAKEGGKREVWSVLNISLKANGLFPKYK